MTSEFSPLFNTERLQWPQSGSTRIDEAGVCVSGADRDNVRGIGEDLDGDRAAHTVVCSIAQLAIRCCIARASVGRRCEKRPRTKTRRE